MDIIGSIYNDIKRLFSAVVEKNSKITSRVRNLLIIILLLFIIIPICINFLSMFEMQQFGLILNTASSLDWTNTSPEILEEYHRFEAYVHNSSLPITEFKNFVSQKTQVFLQKVLRVGNIDLNSTITYIGFGIKKELFMSVFLWNIIPLSAMFLFGSFFADKGKLNKALAVTLFFLSCVLVSAIYCAILGAVISFISILAIISLNFTQTLVGILSLSLTAFMFYKLLTQKKE